jgi:hypothetical protein
MVEWSFPHKPKRASRRHRSFVPWLKQARKAGATSATIKLDDGSSMFVSFVESATAPAASSAADEVESWFEKHAH